MPEKKDRELRRRAFWSGTITFGLVSIPVALLPGNRGRRGSLRMLAPDGTPLRRQFYCPRENAPVARDDLVRGFEFAGGEYVLVEEEELEALEPKKSREIDLRRFVPVEQIDPAYFDRAYFLAPTGDSPKPYRLLAATMERTGRAGIATFVMRTKEYLVAILAENGLLRAETLRFADELREPEAAGLPAAADAPAESVRRIAEAVHRAAADELDESRLRDRYTEKLLELVERKRAAGEDVVHLAGPGEEEEEEEGGEVIDLMEILKRSVGAATEAKEAVREPPPARRPSRRRQTDPKDLETRSRQELYDRARELRIPGRSAMNREELIEAIRRSA